MTQVLTNSVDQLPCCDSHRMLAQASAIIFDFDGVIADSEEFQLRIWAELLCEDGLEADGLTIAAIAGIPDREAIQRAVPGLSAAHYASLTKRKVERCQACSQEIQLVPGIRPLLESLAGHKQLHICSSSEEDHIRRFLERTLPNIAFGEVVGKGSYDRKKPAPDPYLTTIQRARLMSHEAVAIEDSDAGVAAAQAAGIRVIRFDRYGHCPDEARNVSRLLLDLLNWREIG